MLVHICDKCSKIIDNVDNIGIEYNYYSEEGRVLPHMYRLHLCPECFEEMFGKGTLERMRNEKDNKEGM